MKETRITSIIHRFASTDELDADDLFLLEQARLAIDGSYAPYSNFHVGCALRLRNGVIVKGSNQENMAFPSGLCAERVAIFSAGANYPAEAVVAMAITARSDNAALNEPVLSCGACLQSIAEYETLHATPIRIILQGEAGEIWIAEGTKTFLPFQFTAGGLKK